jgi:hypothetical protein
MSNDSPADLELIRYAMSLRPVSASRRPSIVVWMRLRAIVRLVAMRRVSHAAAAHAHAGTGCGVATSSQYPPCRQSSAR